MSSQQSLQADPLFLGLTRPAMIFGVHYLMFVINFMGNILLFINDVFSYKIPAVIIGMVSVHLLFYLICLKEPRAIELLTTRYAKCSKCRNRRYHKFTNSYDLN